MNINSVDSKLSSIYETSNQGTIKNKKNEQEKQLEEKKKIEPRKDFFSDSYVAELDNSEPIDEGLYSLEANEKGEPQIHFSKPKQEDEPVENNNDEEPIIMKCTIDTDHIEKEIKQIDQKKQKVQQDIIKAKNQNDDEKAEQLDAELAKIETELASKDSDAYRKQNAKVSYSKVSK